jgi:hypothetical protein
MTAVPDLVSLVDWHSRRATIPTLQDEVERRLDSESDDSGDESGVPA